MTEKAILLYVDDEALNLRLFEINFRNKYAVYTAENGIKGLEVLSSNPEIMVVVSDMKMPGMNGIEFIKKAKQLYPSIKFYILTGFEITDEIQEALNSKLILNYFQKPFNVNEIDSSITGAIQSIDS